MVMVMVKWKMEVNRMQQVEEWMWKWLNKFLVESVKMNEKSEIPVSKV